ncbi:MAG: antitoxin [Deltaproteobacteria bacterium]|nr:MAG: antitoxin [Deltaproteobacteria bacterium]
MNGEYIDTEEKEIIESFDFVNLRNIQPPTNAEQKKIKEAALKFVKKETKMNIRIDYNELEKIKEFARNEGLKYQTLVKSVLHKYVTGQLIEKRKVG